MPVRGHVFATDFGFVALAWRDEAIVALRLPAEREADAAEALRRCRPDAVPGDPPPPVAATVAAIRRYFAGEAVDFSGVAVDLAPAAPFAARVYAHICGIGRGETTTYGAVARALRGGPEAARAVGRAMATNPVPLIVPCHRVLAAGGSLGGFTAPGGADTKARMLALEGAAPTAQRAFAF